MKIHFVCMGNVYRSRFAEAYARSRSREHEFSSSGLVADESEQNPYGPITWWGARLAYNHDVAGFLTSSKQPTSQSLLEDSDLVVFMHSNVAQKAQTMLELDDINFLTWKTEDLYHMGHDDADELAQKLEFSDNTGKYMVDQVDSLLKSL